MRPVQVAAHAALAVASAGPSCCRLLPAFVCCDGCCDEVCSQVVSWHHMPAHAAAALACSAACMFLQLASHMQGDVSYLLQVRRVVPTLAACQQHICFSQHEGLCSVAYQRDRCWSQLISVLAVWRHMPVLSQRLVLVAWVSLSVSASSCCITRVVQHEWLLTAE